eukprot:2282682-Pyramimonas_sp.AAC.1
MPPWAPVRADVAATSALLFMSRAVTLHDGTVGSVLAAARIARLAPGGLDLLVSGAAVPVGSLCGVRVLCYRGEQRHDAKHVGGLQHP